MPTRPERGFDAIEGRLADVLAPWRFEATEGDLVEAVTAALRACGRTLAVAESCTGGLVAKRMTDLAGASDVFRGGVVAYANEVKIDQLGVDPSELAEHGAVSEVVARRMAEGAARRFGADAGIGITGVAGPGGGTEEKPVGTVWYAAACEGPSSRAASDSRGTADRSGSAPRRRRSSCSSGCWRDVPGRECPPLGLNEPGGGWYLQRPVGMPTVPRHETRIEESHDGSRTEHR